MKRLVLAFIIGALALFVGVISAHEDGVHVRVSHLSPTSPALDVYVGETLVIRQLNYKATSGYLPLDGNMADVALVPAGGTLEEAIYSDSLVFSGDPHGYYTVVAVGDVEDFTFELLVLPVDAQALGTASTDTLLVRGAFARPTVNAMPHVEGEHDMAEATAEATMEMGSHSMDMGSVSAVYMVIENKGDTADRLIAVATDISGMAQIHQTVVTDGIAQMGEVEGGIEIAAGGIIELKPGDYHVMLMDLKGDIVEGTSIPVTLTFESGTTITLDVPVITP
ncbi:MAG: copper chaperone PCu(A)C [bacterium]|nr:copper chaperone PCu(A)C [bacterium]